MIPLIFIRLLVLAQSDDTFRDFLWQVRGLIAFVCALGVLWVALLVLTIQRRAENNRRKKLGKDPLPNMWVGLYQWATGRAEPSTRNRVTAQSPSAPPDAGDDALPAPDLGMLTGELDDDDSGPVTATSEPARSVPAATPATPKPQPAPDLDAATLEQHFMFDDDPHAPAGDSPENAPPDSVEVLRVYRDVSDGTLIVAMGGQEFSTVDEMRSADLERRFTKIVRELAILVRDAQQATKRPPPSRRTPRLQKSPRAEETPKPDDEQPSDDVPRPTPQVRSREDADQAEPPVDPVQPASSGEPPDAAPPDETPRATATLPDDDLPSMAPGAMLRGMTRAAFGGKSETPTDEEPAAEPLSIAEQIDALLQARLNHLPEYRDRTIKVATSPLGGVRIQVDDEFYEGVGEVADDDVRSLLQDVVREWERRR